MNDNENRKSMEELADEALDAVSGGADDLAAFLGLTCEDCQLSDMSVHDYDVVYVNDGCSFSIKLCPACAEKRRQKGDVLR